MAQLSDDCFAFGGALLTVEEALARISERVTCVVGNETVPLRAAAFEGTQDHRKIRGSSVDSVGP